MEVAGKIFEFVADMIEKAEAALNWVWNKIKVMITPALPLCMPIRFVAGTWCGEVFSLPSKSASGTISRYNPRCFRVLPR